MNSFSKETVKSFTSSTFHEDVLELKFNSGQERVPVRKTCGIHLEVVPANTH